MAGGTALHFAPTSRRYSHDLDIFHDAIEHVADAFESDRALLAESGYDIDVIISQPGFIRAVVRRGSNATQIDWARDSVWRFMPLVRDELGGYILHDVDLATNKLLALAGRDEARDFVDILFVIDHVLPLGPLAWASAAKDPGYTPLSLLEQVRRRGRLREEDFSRLDLVRPFDLPAERKRWTEALHGAERFVLSRPPDEAGCLYYSTTDERFVEPDSGSTLDEQDIVKHFGRPGGVLPRPADRRLR